MGGREGVRERERESSPAQLCPLLSDHVHRPSGYTLRAAHHQPQAGSPLILRGR